LIDAQLAFLACPSSCVFGFDNVGGAGAGYGSSPALVISGLTLTRAESLSTAARLNMAASRRENIGRNIGGAKGQNSSKSSKLSRGP